MLLDDFDRGKHTAAIWLGKHNISPVFLALHLWMGNSDISYIIFLCAMTIFTPATIIFACYYVIYRTVRASTRRVQGHSDLRNQGKSEDTSDAKVLKTSLVVVCVYLACWTPISVIGFIEVFGSQSPRLAYFVSYVGAYCSSMTNPFIYGIMNPQFKRAFSTILRLRPDSQDGMLFALPRNQRSNSPVNLISTQVVNQWYIFHRRLSITKFTD